MDRFWFWFVHAPLSEVLMWSSGIAAILTLGWLLLQPDPYRNRRNNGNTR